MSKSNYISPCCIEFKLDIDTAVLAGSLQDYEVDTFDFGIMELEQESIFIL